MFPGFLPSAGVHPRTGLRPRSRFLGIALALLAAGPGAPAWGMFKAGIGRTLHAAGSMEPIAAASLDEDNLFILDSRPYCARCVPGLDTCGHEDFARLVHLQRAAGEDAWQAEEICPFLPPTTEGLVRGPKSTLVLADQDGSLRPLHLSRRGDSWQVDLGYHVLWASSFKDLGFPGRWQTCAIAPDGGIVLGFERDVARLPPGGARSARQVRWLYRGTAGAGECKDVPAPGAGMLVAVDGHDRVWVVDARDGTAFRISADGTKVTPLAKPGSWPAGFIPYDVQVSGRHLFVSGMPAGTERWPTQLVVLTPEGKVEAATRQIIGHRFTFTVTPKGHVVLCDWDNGRVRMIPNLQAGPEGKGESKAEAKADAASPAGPGAGQASEPAGVLAAKPAGDPGTDRARDPGAGGVAGPGLGGAPRAAVPESGPAPAPPSFRLNPGAQAFHMPDG